MRPNEVSGISVREGRVYCIHDCLAAKRRSLTNDHPNMLFWTCVHCDCGRKGWCSCGFLWNRDLIQALEEVPDHKGIELMAVLNSVPEGWPSYDPSQLTAVEDINVTFVACPDWTREQQHHRAIIRYSRRTPPPPSSASNGKRKRDDESSGSQPLRQVTKKVKTEDEDLQFQRFNLQPSTKNESDDVAKAMLHHL